METGMTGQLLYMAGGLLIACLAVVGLCAAAVLPWMVLAARRRTTRTRRGAYERCGQQLTLAVLVCGLGCVAAGVALLAAPMPEAHAAFRPLFLGLSGLSIAGGCAAIAMRPLARHATGLTASGIVAGLCTGLLVLGAIAMHLPWGAGLPAISPEQSLGSLSGMTIYAQRLGDAAALRPDLTALAVLLALGLGLAGAGGMALLVLIVRRNVDDYGRDHYRLAAAWCARWGVWGAVLLAAASCAGWWLYLPSLTQRAGGAPVWQWAGAGGIMLLAALGSWAVVAADEHPMRHKSLMVLGIIGVWGWMALSLWGIGVSLI